jgi:hypothetical protein
LPEELPPHREGSFSSTQIEMAEVPEREGQKRTLEVATVMEKQSLP